MALMDANQGEADTSSQQLVMNNEYTGTMVIKPEFDAHVQEIIQALKQENAVLRDEAYAAKSLARNLEFENQQLKLKSA